MSQEDPTPKLHIDTDWKAEAQAEKERLTAEDQAREQSATGPDAAGGPRELPEASFKTLTGMVLASYHSTYFFQNLMRGIRKAIEEDRFESFRKDFLNRYKNS